MPLFRYVSALAAALLLVLGGCKPPAPPAAPPVPTARADSAGLGVSTARAAIAPGDAAPSAATGSGSTPCPHAEFAAFLQHFSTEIAWQARAVADPLVTEHVDAGAEPEPVTVVRRVPLAEVAWPVMPDPATLSRTRRILESTAQSDGSMQVQVRATDTSDQQTYTFRRQPCWQLVRVVDESI